MRAYAHALQTGDAAALLACLHYEGKAQRRMSELLARQAAAEKKLSDAAARSFGQDGAARLREELSFPSAMDHGAHLLKALDEASVTVEGDRAEADLGSDAGPVWLKKVGSSWKILAAAPGAPEGELAAAVESQDAFVRIPDAAAEDVGRRKYRTVDEAVAAMRRLEENGPP
jgi:hypothetical protein